MNSIDSKLKSFLQSQRVVTLATVDDSGSPWVSNVYYSISDVLEIFFVSPTDTKHSRHIASNSKIAFSVVWFDPDNLGNRKSVQGIGECAKVSDISKLRIFLQNHYKYYPDWKDLINVNNILKNVIKSRPYIIRPDYMKFWNDELYGEEGTKEFNF